MDSDVPDTIIRVTVNGSETWKLVVFAADCKGYPDDEPLICHVCGGDYTDCPCPGPTQDGIEYEEIDGYLYGREINDGKDPETSAA